MSTEFATLVQVTAKCWYHWMHNKTVTTWIRNIIRSNRLGRFLFPEVHQIKERLLPTPGWDGSHLTRLLTRTTPLPSQSVIKPSMNISHLRGLMSSEPMPSRISL